MPAFDLAVMDEARTCHADDAAREEVGAEAACLQAATPPEPQHDQEPGKLRGLVRRCG